MPGGLLEVAAFVRSDIGHDAGADATDETGGLVTPSGFASTATQATSAAGMETPDTIELRKDRRYVWEDHAGVVSRMAKPLMP